MPVNILSIKISFCHTLNYITDYKWVCFWVSKAESMDQITILSSWGSLSIGSCLRNRSWLMETVFRFLWKWEIANSKSYQKRKQMQASRERTLALQRATQTSFFNKIWFSRQEKMRPSSFSLMSVKRKGLNNSITTTQGKRKRKQSLTPLGIASSL